MAACEIRGPRNKVRKYSHDELDKAMDAWDKAVENALPGELLQLVNSENGRIVSEYHNREGGGQE